MMIAVEQISKRFGGITALDGVTASFDAGQRYALVGPNGCGKTTLLNTISGFYRPDAGAIVLRRSSGSEEKPVRLNALSPARRARLGVGRTFQEPRQFPEFTVEQNLLLNLMEFGSDNVFRTGLRSCDARPHAERIAELTELGNLADARNKRTGELSYGQRKILDFLCLIARQSRVMLLDEPFAGVDPRNIETMLRLLDGGEGTIIIVSHEMALVRQVAHEVLLMDQGRMVCSGPPGEILESAAYREVYLG